MSDKEMTRRAIKILIEFGQDVSEFKEEFFRIYGEEV